MQIYRYKLENNTLNSVLDCDSNKNITKNIGWEGPKLYSAKGMAYSDPSSYIFVYIVQSVLYIGMTSLHCSSMASLYLMAI
jgi:hypothetical protein